MSDGTYRGRWEDEVFRSPLITDSTRVALLALVRHMDDAGRVSVPREELVVRLGRNRRKVDARIAAAVEAGFLERLVRGQKGRTAVYQAVAPRLSMPPGGHAEGDEFSMPPGGRTEDASQHAGSKHAEGVQHAGFKHPETAAQHAGFKHPETNQHAPRGTSRDGFSMPPGGRTSYRGDEEVDDNGDVAEVISLFDEEKIKPPPAGAAAPRGERRLTEAQKVVAAYIEGVQDTTGERPGTRRIGHISKQAKTQLEQEHRNCELLVEAARSLGRKVDKNYTDLAAEYLIVAAEKKRAATGTDSGQPFPSAGSSKYAPGSGSQVPPRDSYTKEDYI